MSVFRGPLLTAGDLLEIARAEHEPEPEAPPADAYPTHDAATAAVTCIQLLSEQASLRDCWRFGILQTVDYYNSYRRKGGIILASRVFDREPPRTGSTAVDAAFAALAAHLAEQDGWEAPVWAADPRRVSARPWYVAPTAFRAWADDETPPQFRARGVFITALGLARA
jgi:hypothetical protein